MAGAGAWLAGGLKRREKKKTPASTPSGASGETEPAGGLTLSGRLDSLDVLDKPPTKPAMLKKYSDKI